MRPPVKGTRLHRFISEEKDKSFAVVDLLRAVIGEIPEVGQSLFDANRELAANIQLLFEARNRSTHKGEPSIVLSYKETVTDRKTGIQREVKKDLVYAVTPALIFDPLYEVDDDDPGYFTADVLCVIGWLESKIGGNFVNEDIAAYWEEQRKRPFRFRAEALIESALEE